MKPKRGKNGRFTRTRGAYIDDHGYVRLSCGPYRNVRLHTIVAEAMLGRKLKPDEDVHHRNGNKLDIGFDNLQVMGHKEHGAVSRKQAWYFRENDIKAEKEWDDYFEDRGGALNSHDRP